MPLQATHLQCLCGAIHEPATLLSSHHQPSDTSTSTTILLPIPESVYRTTICHCNICRQTTGAVGAWFVPLKGRPSETSMANVSSYNATKDVTRYFCSTCGCNVFIFDGPTGHWIACAGIVETEDTKDNQAIETTQSSDVQKPGKNISNLQYHEWVDDVKDGGWAAFLTRLDNGRQVPFYKVSPHQSKEQLSLEELLAVQQRARTKTAILASSRGDRHQMRATCHCGGVDLRIDPPPIPDTHNHSHQNDTPTSEPPRYPAAICCCRSCRLSLGFALQPWTYVPPDRIRTASGELVAFGPDTKNNNQIEKMKHYQSSENVLRSFCTSCGATVFFQDANRMSVIDVSVGIIRSDGENGMVEEWLKWNRSGVSARDEVVEEELVNAWVIKE
ncbi:hypothetical protein B0A52_07466 [Exophiala mesophila]|uniref:CENP-V/GFA domain-containing protein n=1 Tax=Exophiala mesophila TaxID=212818 RepID=A0A438MZS4_EXOME|nr:hypothetical protein B0A52_07466 [Exophiala mesophila]